MNIFDDPNDSQKRLEGQISGMRGAGYAEIFPNPNKKLEKLLEKIKASIVELSARK